MRDTLLILTAAAYLLSVILLYRDSGPSHTMMRRLAVLMAGLGSVLHGWVLWLTWAANPWALSIGAVLSLCALVVVVVLLLSLLLSKPLFDAGLLALPMASVAVLLEWFWQSPGTVSSAQSAGITTHVISSVLAFGVLSIAAVYAIFAAVMDHFLRTHRINAWARRLPALEVLESLLFQLIALGFFLLTVSLTTGLLYVNDLLAQHLAHKTILSVLAWLVFGVLLWGHYFRGWRGRLAVRLTLAGIVLLLLSYFGSKLVLELILERHWQSGLMTGWSTHIG